VSVEWSGAPEEDVIINVRDEGLGIPPQDLPRLFTRYSRVGDGSHFYRSGLGIGLYITKEIVDSHSGRISVTSEPGQGSTFTVSLPLQPRRAPRPAAGETAAPVSAPIMPETRPVAERPGRSR
jgi:signal transduction histidine kinase